jgi:hypothetical protein
MIVAGREMMARETRTRTVLVGLLFDLLGDLVVQLGVGRVSFGGRHNEKL